jgi:hypothetical protein
MPIISTSPAGRPTATSMTTPPMHSAVPDNHVLDGTCRRRSQAMMPAKTGPLAMVHTVPSATPACRVAKKNDSWYTATMTPPASVDRTWSRQARPPRGRTNRAMRASVAPPSNNRAAPTPRVVVSAGPRWSTVPVVPNNAQAAITARAALTPVPARALFTGCCMLAIDAHVRDRIKYRRNAGATRARRWGVTTS